MSRIEIKCGSESRSKSLTRAYHHGYDARAQGKPRESSYDQPAWAGYWYAGWDRCNTYIASGHGITTSTARAEGGYASVAGHPNVAPSNWSKLLRKAWHEGWEQFNSVRLCPIEPPIVPWVAPPPPWAVPSYDVHTALQRAAQDLTALKLPVPKFMQYFSSPSAREDREYLKERYVSDDFADSLCYVPSGRYPVKFMQLPSGLGKASSAVHTSINKETNAMNSTLAFVFASLLPDVVSVKVTFPSTYKEYTYKALKSQEIAEGDTVVVDSPASGPTLVHVKSVGTFEDLDAGAYQGYKWIVGKVNIGDYGSVIEKETKFYEKVAELQRKAKAQKALEQLAESLGGMDVLKALMGEIDGTQAAPAALPTVEGDGV